jgi:hypothetical protein
MAKKIQLLMRNFVLICLLVTKLGILRADTQTPDKILEQLLAQEHQWGNEEVKDLVEMIEQNPDPYMPALRIHLRLPAEIDDLASAERLHFLERVLGIVRIVGPQGRLIAQSFFDQVSTQIELSSAVSRKPETVRNLKQLQRGILKLMIHIKDDYAVDYCVRQVTSEQELASRNVMLEYLAVTATTRPDIRSKLEEMNNSPTSSLRNHPQLLRVLDAIDKAATEQKKEGNDRKDQERKDQ